MMAMTADGKIATVAREAARFSGEEDRRRLAEEVAWADALLVAAGTIRAYGTTYRVRDPALAQARADRGQAEQPATVVVTRSLDLALDLPFFVRQRIPRIIATLAPNEDEARRRFGDLAEVIATGEGDVDLPALVDALARRGMRRVLALGGGTLNFDLVAAGLVDEVYLTISPWLFGGATAPSILDGPGFPIDRAVRLHLAACEVVGEEVFFRYEVAHPAR